MNEQMTMYELFPETVPNPGLWKCMETCANCGIYMDKFPIDRDGDRCLYGMYQDGSSGNDIYEIVHSDSTVSFYCKYYKPKG